MFVWSYCRFGYRNQCRQDISHALVGLSKGEIQLAIQSIQAVVSGLGRVFRHKSSIGWTNLILRFLNCLESSGGKHYDAETNNPLGWNNGKAVFPSVHAAIRHVSAELGSGRWYAGKTLEEKLRVYNPRPAYSVKVMDCMRQFTDNIGL